MTTATRTIPSRLLMTAALIALAAALSIYGLLNVGAQDPEPVLISEPPAEEEHLTTLTIEGSATTTVTHDGAVASFTVSVLRTGVLDAVSTGNKAVKAIADRINATCATTAPKTTSTTPTCVSKNGLQTTSIRLVEEFTWTDRGRESQGFRYENSLSIAIDGTDYAGNLIDLVVTAGGDNVRFNSLSFTASGRAAAERDTQLDAIDDAMATAEAIAEQCRAVLEVNRVFGSPACHSRAAHRRACGCCRRRRAGRRGRRRCPTRWSRRSGGRCRPRRRRRGRT